MTVDDGPARKTEAVGALGEGAAQVAAIARAGEPDLEPSRANEIMVAIAVTDSGRPLPRVGGLTKAEIKGEDGLR